MKLQSTGGWRRAVAALLALCTMGPAAANPWSKASVGVYLAHGDKPMSAAMYACVHELIRQGVSLVVATRECYLRLQTAAELHTEPFGAVLDAHGIRTSGWATGPGIRAMCGGGANPMLAGPKGIGDVIVKDGPGEGQFTVTTKDGSFSLIVGPITIVERVASDGKVIRHDPPTPPKTDGGTKREAGASTCAAVVEEARPLLSECQRTAWKSAQCQSVRAEAKQCPDPSLIYVDPQQGYACGESVDAEAARRTYETLCRRTVRPVPGGPDPCRPGDPLGAGMVYPGPPPDDLCVDPRAQDAGRTDGEECLAVYEPGNPVPGMTPQQLLVWAQSRFGGPVFVLPMPGGGGGGSGPRPGAPPQCMLTPC